MATRRLNCSGGRQITGRIESPCSTIVLRPDAVWRVVLSDTALRELKRIPKVERGNIKEGIRRHLVDADPRQTTRNKFRLRRASQFAEYQLRLEPWRVFHRIEEHVVQVILIGEKRGNKLVIGAEEFIL